MQSECEEAMSGRGALQRLHQPSQLSRKMRRSISKVKRSIQRMTEESHEEEEEEMARRLLRLPRENLASLTCRTGFSREEVRRLYRAFKQQCPNGVATTKDLTPAYAKLFPLGDSRKYAEIVFNNFDEDKDGFVSFGDLLTGLASIVKGSADQRLSWIFRLYDLNGDGCITRREMTTGVSAIYEMVRSAQVIDCAVERHVNRLFEKMDLNRDGVISRDEFLDCCKNDQLIYNQLSVFDNMQY
ncbi:Kv channel-interacting protein 2 isoform X3 [Nasonia vitripennis]|uniref:EF-hand domain-containing protein n=1 Tax=Nasonia vitripennis TaxID=7425 RepID=A0A7M7QMN4_NASVI|nr:Kv channel-interacting protein 2 isoform X3 [Nasonia vitripennis]